MPVVQIFHVEPAGPFSLESGHVRTLEGLRIAPAAVFHKTHHSALVGNDLGPWLTRNGINRLFVTGIRTEQCCETTTRNASDLGFTVDFLIDATLTFEMQHARTGRVFTADEIKERTELVLAGRFGRVTSVTKAFGELAAAG